jgi:5-formyltetrahydrofolate cyclo-ligase|tara:strand:- start:26 stop:583 length:558 start_codon:yes stop_codon:yes gene_type:complete
MSLTKEQLRIKFFKIRKKKYFEISSNFFLPLLSIIKKKIRKNSFTLSIYYPSNYEVDALKIFDKIKNKKIQILLPAIFKNNVMKFYKWKDKDPLRVNQYGMLEPHITKNDFIPDIMLVPLLVYDKENFRLGYGKGYYDRYLNMYLKKNKNIITIGVAFEFQKYKKIPTSTYDVKLDKILTEKGIL